MEVHEKIKFIRLFRGWSQEEMAERLGMVLNGYTKIEQGKVDINLSRLKQIAETLGVEVAQLVGLSEKNIFNFIENHTLVGIPGHFVPVSKKWCVKLLLTHLMLNQVSFHSLQISERIIWQLGNATLSISREC